MGARRSTPRQEVYKSFDAFYTEPQHLEVQLPAPLAAPLAKTANDAQPTAQLITQPAAQLSALTFVRATARLAVQLARSNVTPARQTK